MKKKLNVVLAIVILCIIIAGIAVISTLGFEFDLNYTNNKQITIYLGKEFEVKDIENIVKEITGQDRVIVQKVEVYEDMVSIKVKDITDEQVEQLNNKINEKYELENKLEEDLIVNENANVRGRSLIKPYIIPIAISLILVTIYFMIYMIINYKSGKEQNVIKNLIKVILTIILVQLVYVSLLAILRIPINRLVIPIAIILYVVTTIILMYKLEKEYRNLKNK